MWYLNVYKQKMSKKRFLWTAIIFVAWVVLMLGQTNAKERFYYDTWADCYRVYSEDFENFVIITSKNLWAEETGANWYVYQWWNNYWFSENDFRVTEELAIRNNKFNNSGYNLWNKFIINTIGDYWSYWLHHDWLWWWMDDNRSNMRWQNLITWGSVRGEAFDVYDTDIFRQWPCPKGFHVPSYWDFLELEGYLNEMDDKSFSDLKFPSDIEYRNMDDGNILKDNWLALWTSSPAENGKAIAINSDGQRVDVSRSMWLQVRCFQNKRDAMVWVTSTGSDIVFYDTKEPSVEKGTERNNLILLDGKDRTEFVQWVGLKEYVKWAKLGYLYLQACTSWADPSGNYSLLASKLSLSVVPGVDLGINCDNSAIDWNPWDQNSLDIEVTWHVSIDGNNRATCNQVVPNDPNNRIKLKVSSNFVKDFSVNKSLYTEILSDYVYAPTSSNDNTILWNYIYNKSPVITKWIDGDNFVVNDDDLIFWWTGSIWSAEQILENDLECIVIDWPSGLDPKCIVTGYQLDTPIYWTIYSCKDSKCEPCESNNKWQYCWRNNSDKYQSIVAPFRWHNTILITGTWDTYELDNGTEWTIKISLKNKWPLGCYAMGDGTDSTYVKIKFKKIISPYKAWYLSWDYGWVRYSQYNLWTTLKSWGTDQAFQFYVSNPQTAKSWGYSWWALAKVNFAIDFNQEVPNDHYDIVWNSTVGDYQKEINIQKSTSDNEENPDAYKFTFPSY